MSTIYEHLELFPETDPKPSKHEIYIQSFELHYSSKKGFTQKFDHYNYSNHRVKSKLKPLAFIRLIGMCKESIQHASCDTFSSHYKLQST